MSEFENNGGFRSCGNNVNFITLKTCDQVKVKFCFIVYLAVYGETEVKN